jgi:hypothetical protein
LESERRSPRKKRQEGSRQDNVFKRFPVALVCVMVPRQALPEEALPALAVAAHFPMPLSGVWRV